MIWIGIVMIGMGIVLWISLFAWRIGQLADRIEDLEYRADRHQAELCEIDPGWLP